MLITIDTQLKEEFLKLLTVFPKLLLKEIEVYSDKTTIILDCEYATTSQALFDFGYNLGLLQKQGKVTNQAVENLKQLFIASPQKMLSYSKMNKEYMIFRKPILDKLIENKTIRVFNETKVNIHYEYIGEE